MIKTNTDFKTLILAMTLLLATSYVIAQESELFEKEHGKLDFSVASHVIDSTAGNDSPLFDLTLEVQRRGIVPQMAFIKILSEQPREIYFIRAIDKELLSGSKDEKTWEKERIDKEKKWQALRVRHNKKRRKSKRLPEGPAYEKQRGKLIKKVELSRDKIVLEFGPFSPGDYQVYLRITDKTGRSYFDRQNITISADDETIGKGGNSLIMETNN